MMTQKFRSTALPRFLWFGLLVALFSPLRLAAQGSELRGGIPLTVSVFSESVSLPDFRGLFRGPGWGVRLGTELCYRQGDGHRLLQTINLGYYHHPGFQQGVYVSSEFGYRKRFGGFFADATIGGGYLHLVSSMKRYEPDGEGYRNASPRLHKFMPTIGLGLGYQFGKMAFFSRYEAFGELPFSYRGAPALPHRSLHVGTRFNPF